MINIIEIEEEDENPSIKFGFLLRSTYTGEESYKVKEGAGMRG